MFHVNCDCCEHDPDVIARQDARREAEDREFDRRYADRIARVRAEPCKMCAELQLRVEQLEAELAER